MIGSRIEEDKQDCMPNEEKHKASALKKIVYIYGELYIFGKKFFLTKHFILLICVCKIWFSFIWTSKFGVRIDFLEGIVLSAPPAGWHLYNILSSLLICRHIYSKYSLNMPNDFQTSTMKFRQLMAQIDLF